MSSGQPGRANGPITLPIAVSLLIGVAGSVFGIVSFSATRELDSIKARTAQVEKLVIDHERELGMILARVERLPEIERKLDLLLSEARTRE